MSENLGKNISEIFDNQNKYIIPLYQRNFSWRREQIEQLLQDIYTAFKQNQYGHYYIGSLVVLKRSNGDFEVIDGQQRLTVLSLITKILHINKEPRLFYDSRPEVEEFFRVFYNSDDDSCSIDYPQTAHLRNAIDFIKEINLDAENPDDGITIKSIGEDFKRYFKYNVILVRVEIPQDTDVASYFEIMNNRGVQLQKHEILKSFLINKLDSKYHSEFAKIWTACSQMDIQIQKLFTADDRCKYFGEKYDSFNFDKILELGTSEKKESYKTIDVILNTDSPNSDINNVTNNTQSEDENENESKYKSIIDFPNFLMHVFNVVFPNNSIPLNEKYLIDTFKSSEKNWDSELSIIFIKTLFFCRTIFDRYVVKTSPDTDTKSEDGEKWTLIKPKKYENGKWTYIQTFGKTEEKEDKLSYEQDRIIKALSMLQVTFRTRIYKDWLCDILKWFVEKNTVVVGYKEYLEELDKIILKKYDNIAEFKSDVPEEKRFRRIEDDNITKENSYSKGLSTPHFLFNFIDYLYWVDSKEEKNIEGSKKVEDFDFKYWNSIEHHMAREWAARNTEKLPDHENYIDNLGNLCLISKSANSRLSDRDAKEKAETFDKGNLGANRQIMYAITKENNGNYRKEQIVKHYNELLDLLSRREEILRNDD